VTIQDVLDHDKFQRLQRLYVTSPLPKNDDWSGERNLFSCFGNSAPRISRNNW
jgi:hypothetical protein